MSGLIVSDVDGVVLDFYKGAARVLQDMFNRDMPVVDNRPATRYRYGLTMEQYQQMREVMLTHPHGWANLPTLPGAVEAIEQLNAAGHEVVFLSSCGQKLYDLRRQNLDAIGLGQCRLICVEDHQPNSKGEILNQLSPKAFIDDHVKMLIQAPDGLEKVWIDHGCDMELDEDGVPYVYRITVSRHGSLSNWAQDFLARNDVHPKSRMAPI